MNRPRATAIAPLLLALTLTAAAVSAQGREPVLADPERFLQRAGELLDQGRVLESLDLYGRLARLAETPELRATALMGEADTRSLFLGQKSEALSLYEKALDAAPPGMDMENAVFGSAMLLYELDKPEEAGQRFGSYLMRYPRGVRRGTAWYMLERIHHEMEEGARLQAGYRPRFHEESDPDATPALEPQMRVLLGRDSRVSLHLPQGAALSAPGRGTRSLPPGEHLFLERDGVVVMDGRSLGRMAVLSPGQGGFGWNGRAYQGEALLVSEGGRLACVNRLGMEEYLLGVLPMEMPTSFPLPALRAQAVASRSFALAMRRSRAGREYDLTADTASQVFGGSGAGTAATEQAVRSTRGEALIHAGEPVLSYFHSHSGGVLEDDVQVWNTDLPYYRVAPDPVSELVRSSDWEYRVDATELARILREGGYAVTRVHYVAAGTRSPSGRMNTVHLSTEKGLLELKANDLRLLLGPDKLRSTLCSVEQEEEGAFRFTGKGHGHGVGMSQWGAQGMALQGADYRQILEHYYPGVAPTQIY
jgi:stage II sporulation protein D